MSSAWLVLAAVGLALTLLIWARLLWQSLALQSGRVLGLTRPNLEGAPEVTALIPTLNEERDIGACLRALLAVDYPRLSIVVSDDGSRDATVARVQAIAAETPPGKLRIISTPADDPRREGWRLGKSFALWVGAQGLTSEWLWFVDADVRVDPDSLWRSLEASRVDDTAGFTCGGRYPNPSAWGGALEAWLYTLLFVFLPLRRIRDPRDTEASWLTGQFFLLRRSVYESVGGHFAAKHYSQDDLGLARLCKRKHHLVSYYPAAEIFTCVNYSDFPETWRNWIRLCVLGAPWIGLGLKHFVACTAVILGLGVLSPAGLLVAWLTSGGPLLVGLLCAQNSLLLLLLLTLHLSMGKRVWTPFLFPLTALLTSGLLTRVCSSFQGTVLFHDQALPQDQP